MTTHKNFYETLTEAQMRLRQTVVPYDGQPYFVRAITNHMKDGIFRVYLEPLLSAGNSRYGKGPNYNLYVGMENYNAESPDLGRYIDEFLTKNPSCEIIRKKINSPHFNKFRPFPLGMVNIGEDPNASSVIHGRCYFTERQPSRGREQGLTAAMCDESQVTLGLRDIGIRRGLNTLSFYTKYFEDMLLGKYPSFKEAYDALTDPDVTNEAIAFNRLFALVRGPVDTMFLGYKDKIIGQINKETKVVRLGKDFKQYREVTQELGVFSSVTL